MACIIEKNINKGVRRLQYPVNWAHPPANQLCNVIGSLVDFCGGPNPANGGESNCENFLHLLFDEMLYTFVFVFTVFCQFAYKICDFLLSLFALDLIIYFVSLCNFAFSLFPASNWKFPKFTNRFGSVFIMN